MRQGSERHTGSQWASKSGYNIEPPTLTLCCLSRIRRQGSVAGCAWLMGLLNGQQNLASLECLESRVGAQVSSTLSKEASKCSVCTVPYTSPHQP